MQISALKQYSHISVAQCLDDHTYLHSSSKRTQVLMVCCSAFMILPMICQWYANDMMGHRTFCMACFPKLSSQLQYVWLYDILVLCCIHHVIQHGAPAAAASVSSSEASLSKPFASQQHSSCGSIGVDLLTAMLMCVCFPGNIAPLAVGVSLVLDLFAAAAYSGGGVSPARVLGPAIVFHCHWNTAWVYMLGGELSVWASVCLCIFQLCTCSGFCCSLPLPLQ